MRLVKNIVLIGMPCCGKTAVAKKLASILGVMSVDTDELVEFELGQKVAEIFTNHGEKVFRKYETMALSSAVKMENVVISTGGGVVESQTNINLLKDCFVIYLSASKNALLKRLDGTNRPLLKGDIPKKLDDIYLKRKNIYESWRDATVFTSSISIHTVAKRIYDILIDMNIAES
ncbi:MAG TPA: shikimate kinase [Clostridia bacterium]|nr:shikimate kinase [Clostridia bacterium]